MFDFDHAVVVPIDPADAHCLPEILRLKHDLHEHRPLDVVGASQHGIVR